MTLIARYHDECLQLTKEQILSIEIFYCSVCFAADDQLVTVYKKSDDTHSAPKVCCADYYLSSFLVVNRRTLITIPKISDYHSEKCLE